ncbi:MAG: outer membrane protein assembly factor BamD [Verrucomicrobiae bacterium]|nr:outer membrane protein assembly factor BamD [Verrucomicrobiae bacterium]
MPLRLPLLCLLAGLLASSGLQAAIVWRPGEGFETEGAETAGSSKETLAQAKALESEKKFSEALKIYRAGARKFPFSFVAAELQYGWGRMEEIDGDFGRAFKVYQSIVEKYPNSEFFDKALERQFYIGNLFLAGERQRLWKIPTLPSMDKTVEYFEKIVKSAPYSRWAPESQFKIGVAREKQKKWSAAVEAYQKVLDKYPGSDLASLAQYQIGYAWMKASKEAEYDQSAASKAILGFEDFLTRFPNSEKVAQAQENIQNLKGKQNKGTFNIARFYDRQKDYKAAVIYYSEVIQENAESELAKQAAERIEELNRILVEQGEVVPGTKPQTPNVTGPLLPAKPAPSAVSRQNGPAIPQKSQGSNQPAGPPVPPNLPPP